MSEIINEIIPEVNKIYKSRFTFAIEKFLTKLNVASRLDIPIPGLTTCHLEVYPNQQKTSLSMKALKLKFRMDAPISPDEKQRTVKLEVTGYWLDICYWVDEFSYNRLTERIKEEFMNQLHLKSCLNDDETLILNGTITVKEMNWEEASCFSATGDVRGQNLIRDIHSLVSGTLADFTFIVEGRDLEVHKAILAARSPVFKRMFTGNFIEATAKKQEVKDIAADVFEEFLYFLYTGDFRNEDCPVEDLIIVADRYEVKDLLHVCEAKLLKSINDKNAESVFRLTNRINCNPELKKISFQVLQSIFDRFKIPLPGEFIIEPEKVFRSIEMKKQLAQVLSIAPPELSSFEELYTDQSANEESFRMDSASDDENTSLITIDDELDDSTNPNESYSAVDAVGTESE